MKYLRKANKEKKCMHFRVLEAQGIVSGISLSREGLCANDIIRMETGTGMKVTQQDKKSMKLRRNRICAFITVTMKINWGLPWAPTSANYLLPSKDLLQWPKNLPSPLLLPLRGLTHEPREKSHPNQSNTHRCTWRQNTSTHKLK